MGTSVSIELDDGRLVVRHRADAAGADRLRRVAARLEEAAHPGVVSVCRSGPAGDGWELVVAHAGSPLAPSRVTDPGRLAAVAADMADTLAALHARGIVHGRLTAGHVLVGSDGRGVLCGLGPGDDAGGDRERDVAGLGAVLAGLVPALAARGAADRAVLRELSAVAARARAEPASRRPAARRMAAELRALAGPPPRSASRGGGAVRRATVGVLAGAAAVGAAVATGAHGGGGPTVERPATTALDRPPASTLPSPEPCVARAGRPVVARDCGQRAVVERGTVVIDGQRSVVGRPGDEVVVADWDCAGTLRPAVLRPATGEVLVLGPPDGAGARAVEAAVRVAGATGLVVEADRGGCATLLVASGDDPPTPFSAAADGAAG